MNIGLLAIGLISTIPAPFICAYAFQRDDRLLFAGLACAVLGPMLMLYGLIP